MPNATVSPKPRVTSETRVISRNAGPRRAGARRHGRCPARRVSPHDRVGDPHVGAPNYLVRRLVALVLVVAAVLLLAAVMTGLLAGFGGDPASASGAQPAQTEPRYHVAGPGDSLWVIASEHRGDVGMNGYLDALIDLNGGTSIIVGQAVRLP